MKHSTSGIFETSFFVKYANIYTDNNMRHVFREKI